MAAACGLSAATVNRIWRAFGLQPHRTETFKLSRDPVFVEKVRDIRGSVPASARARGGGCAWTRSRRFKRWSAAIRCCRCVQASRSGRTRDYRRHGTTSLFAALDVATGKVLGRCSRATGRWSSAGSSTTSRESRAGGPRHSSGAGQLRHAQDGANSQLAGWPAALPPALHATSSSWINQVERWFAAITERQIRRGTYRSTEELEQAIVEYLRVHNENPKPFIWTKSPDQIFESLKIYCGRISETGHVVAMAHSEYHRAMQHRVPAYRMKKELQGELRS